MTVEELIVWLKKLPKDAMVTISNNSTFVNGEYQVTDVVYYELEDEVEITTDYAWIKNDDGKWINDWEEEDDE